MLNTWAEIFHAMSVPQAEMCWKISAKKIQLFPRMRVGEKHSVLTCRGEEKKENQTFSLQSSLALMHCLKLARRNNFIRTYFFFFFNFPHENQLSTGCL